MFKSKSEFFFFGRYIDSILATKCLEQVKLENFFFAQYLPVLVEGAEFLVLFHGTSNATSSSKKRRSSENKSKVDDPKKKEKIKISEDELKGKQEIEQNPDLSANFKNSQVEDEDRKFQEMYVVMTEEWKHIVWRPLSLENKGKKVRTVKGQDKHSSRQIAEIREIVNNPIFSQTKGLFESSTTTYD